MIQFKEDLVNQRPVLMEERLKCQGQQDEYDHRSLAVGGD